MIRLIQFLIFGHIHDWVILEKRDLESPDKRKGVRFILTCVHCGNVKKEDLI